MNASNRVEISKLSVHAGAMFRLLCMVIALSLTGCVSLPRSPNVAELQRYEFEQPQMGVPFRMVLYAKSELSAQNAAEAAFARIGELNATMSDYETDSELSKLSRSSEQGSPEVKLSDDLWLVLQRAQRLAQETGGAFDATVGPCVALWRNARREQEFPDPVRLDNARRKVGFQNLVLDEKSRSARLLRFGMRLDLGAIAKGYAADEALETLREHGINRALVAASGDLALGDSPPGEKGWKVEIAGYDQPNGPPSSIALLANCGVATSGDLFQRLELNGVRYSHILNPFTCVGMTNHAVATVIAKDSITADSLATAMTVLEPTSALKVANRYNAAVRIVRLEKETPVLTQNRRFLKLTNK
jgi:thiamine biosynthesis lipoprotein